MMARAPDPGAAASLSGFAQSAGYLVASAGPLEVGLLHTATGSWDTPFVAAAGPCRRRARRRRSWPPGRSASTGLPA